MLAMFLYGIGIIYTPGTINLMSMNLGLNKKFKSSIGFFLGASLAMFILFSVYGYTSEKFVKKEYLIYLSAVGSVYIAYLAYKIFRSKVDVESSSQHKMLGFKDGFFIQLFNPKATLTALPIATINFEACNIVGAKILLMSLILTILVFGAPVSYCLLGQFFSSFIKNNKTLKILNTIMALLLLFVAFSIFKEHVYDVLIGVRDF